MAVANQDFTTNSDQASISCRRRSSASLRRNARSVSSPTLCARTRFASSPGNRVASPTQSRTDERKPWTVNWSTPIRRINMTSAMFDSGRSGFWPGNTKSEIRPSWSGRRISPRPLLAEARDAPCPLSCAPQGLSINLHQGLSRPTEPRALHQNAVRSKSGIPTREAIACRSGRLATKVGSAGTAWQSDGLSPASAIRCNSLENQPIGDLGLFDSAHFEHQIWAREQSRRWGLRC